MQAHYIVVSLDAFGAKIKWDGKVSFQSINHRIWIVFWTKKLNLVHLFYFQQLVHVEVQENLWNRTEGLCGVMDGDPQNDIITKDRQIPKSILTAASSWKIEDLDGMYKIFP